MLYKTKRSFARSYLFAPGNSQKLLKKVYETHADGVVLDLEDSVPTAEKDKARKYISDAVAYCSTLESSFLPITFIRVNGMDTGRTKEDIEQTVGPGVCGIRLPKVESSEAVKQVSSWLSNIEQKEGMRQGEIYLDCTIETALGVISAADIAKADPRVNAFVFGHADFCKDTGVIGNLGTLYARSHLTLVSRSAGISPPIDGAYTLLDDTEGLKAATREAKNLGFFGKSAIHPKQLSTIHAVFTPTNEEIETAHTIVKKFEVAQEQGVGAIKLSTGEFIDQAVFLQAKRLLSQVKRYKN